MVRGNCNKNILYEEFIFSLKINYWIKWLIIVLMRWDWQVKAPAVDIDDLSLFPRSRTMGLISESCLLSTSLTLWHAHLHMHMHTNIFSK